MARIREDSVIIASHMKQVCFVLGLLLAVCPVGRAQSRVDKRLMSDAEYSAFLRQVETKLPIWEAALKRIDPSKEPTISYAVGQSVVGIRNLGLSEVAYARTAVQQEKAQHKVSRELALSGFLQGVFDAMDTITSLDPSSPLLTGNDIGEMSQLIGRIKNDTQARVELLEESCPASGTK